MSFYIYDIAFLILATIALVIFVSKKKRGLKREGLIYLYRTKLGIKFIEETSKKYQKFLKVMQYFSVLCGYMLMAGITWLLGLTLYTYLKFPQITEQIKSPPIFPLIPYFPELFGLTSFFPPFYFIYWILALAIVAVVHEASHGVFARFYKIKVKSTGFAFLGPFLGAFVEPDEKQMQKKPIFQQLSVLSAGTFANILTAVLVFFALWGMFNITFQESGVMIKGYAGTFVNLSDIASANLTLEQPNISYSNNLSLIAIGENKFFISRESITNLPIDAKRVYLFYDTPALRVGLSGALTKINDKKIKNIDELQSVMEKFKPDEKILVETKTKNETRTNEAILVEHPDKIGAPFIGIASSGQKGSALGKVFRSLLFFNDPSVYYESRSNIAVFAYHFLWWLFMINFFVALFNML
ncbi:MAG: site-2 protease family protein, partial [Nanoarchaeota archaeon]